MGMSKNTFFTFAITLLFSASTSLTAADKVDSTQVSKKLTTIDAELLRVNANVVKTIQRQITVEKNKTEEFLDRSVIILPYVSKEINTNNLPQAMQYLPAAVSRFNKFNMTEHGVGIWNLPYIIGRRYGLQIDHDIDERRDIAKSTKAAIAYLKDLQKQYNNWYYTFFAFVTSPSELNGILQNEEKTSFYSLYNRLSETQQNYYDELVSAAYVCNFYQDHQLSKHQAVTNVNTTYITAHTHISIKDLVARIQMNETDFLSYNLSLRGNNIPKGFQFQLPNYKIELYESIKDSLKLGTKVASIDSSATVSPTNASINNSKTPSPTPQTSTNNNNKTIYHKVKSGDTVWGICKKYGITEAKLKAHNKINGNNIQIGQTLKIIK